MSIDIAPAPNARPGILTFNVVCGSMEYYGVAYDSQCFDSTATQYCVLVCMVQHCKTIVSQLW